MIFSSIRGKRWLGSNYAGKAVDRTPSTRIHQRTTLPIAKSLPRIHTLMNTEVSLKAHINARSHVFAFKQGTMAPLCMVRYTLSLYSLQEADGLRFHTIICPWSISPFRSYFVNSFTLANCITISEWLLISFVTWKLSLLADINFYFQIENKTLHSYFSS